MSLHAQRDSTKEQKELCTINGKGGWDKNNRVDPEESKM
jgi:hypothetical protein